MEKQNKSKPAAQFLHGPANVSLGGLMEETGFHAVPSYRQPRPGVDRYFSGGFIVKEYGSRDGGEVDAISIEAPSEVR